jgi:signal transduction histidine kinase
MRGFLTWPQGRRSLAGYGLATGLAAAAIGIGFAVRSTPLAQGLPLLLLAAIAVSARLGGFGPGLAATLVSVLASDYFLFPPFGSFGVESPLHALELVILCVLGSLIGQQIGVLSPIRGMSRLMRSVASERDFSRRLGQVRGGESVGQLAQNIDVLLATVDDTLRSHRDFMAETAHDLRSPLLALRTNLDLLDREADAAERQRSLDEARFQVDRMATLISDLMLLGERETFLLANPEPVNLARVVRKAVVEAQRHAGRDRVSLRAPGTVMVLGSELRLSQIVANLVDNALKHTPRSAAVDVTLECQADQVRLTVADAGPGIPAEHLPRIFERGYRVKPGETSGHGLGLAIVERLTEAHGGRVEAASNPDGGSTFTVSLPVSDSADQAVSRLSGRSQSLESPGSAGGDPPLPASDAAVRP